MATDVVMPQMGESIAEGTISKWLVKVGQKVERDQPLFEISTDKVDAEIPSPASGVVLEIRHQQGATVAVNTARPAPRLATSLRKSASLSDSVPSPITLTVIPSGRMRSSSR